MDRFRGEIRHSSTYRDPDEFRGRRVLVVGGGNSGVDIACDAALFASQAYLSVRRGYRYIPKHIGGVPTDALLAGVVAPPAGVSLPTDQTKFLDQLVGDLTRYGLPAPDHELLASHPIMNTQVLHHLGHGDLIARAGRRAVHRGLPSCSPTAPASASTSSSSRPATTTGSRSSTTTCCRGATAGPSCT